MARVALEFSYRLTALNTNNLQYEFSAASGKPSATCPSPGITSPSRFDVIKPVDSALNTNNVQYDYTRESGKPSLICSLSRWSLFVIG